MALAAARIVLAGETPYAHEREAIDFAVQSLPNTDPYNLWGLVELVEPSSGRLYEIDLLVIGYAAIYLIEVKSGPGRYEGDSVDWWRVPPAEPARWMDPPLRLANLKAKVLKSRLSAKLGERAPWIQPLVFLSNTDTQLALKPEGAIGVVTRANFTKALTHHEFPGAGLGPRGRPINAPLLREIHRALPALGLRARKGKAYAGPYELQDVLTEGAGYQDRLAVHRDNPRMRRRARVYLVPQQTSVERRQQLRRAADREAQLLYDVREHPSVLTCNDYVTDAPLGPTVLLDVFEGGQPLSAFIRSNPNLPFFDRVHLVEQVGRALAFCHRKGVIHGALSPDAVLVRRHPETEALETRLYNFQLGASGEVEATSHLTEMLGEPWAVYQPPEMREGQRSGAADVFALGAVAYFVFTGRAPAETVAQLDERLKRDRHLDARAVDDTITKKLGEALEMATKLSTLERADSVEAWVEILLQQVTEPESTGAPTVDPLQAREGDPLGEGLTVCGVLGHGATARVLEVEREGRAYALKVSLGPDYDGRLREEGRVLRSLRHSRIISIVDTLTLGGRTCLLLALAGERNLQTEIGRQGAVSVDYAGRWGEDLLWALEYLEDEANVVHRDIKPANLVVGASGKEAVRLTLLDFSLAPLAATELEVGTSAYRDPFLRQRGGWDFAADRWSAAVTLHEMLTGVRPTFGDRQGSALDSQAPLLLAAERFDTRIRDRLVDFFTRALDRDADRRFPRAKEMRHAWNVAIGEQAPAGTPEEPRSLVWDPAVLAAIAPEAPVMALPLTTRATSALDRAGLVRAGDLQALPDNRLSAIRGIGTAVAKEILAFRNQWQQAQALAPVDPRPFFPGYRGEDLLLSASGSPPAVAAVLEDAGLPGLRAVAEAPAAQIEALVRRTAGSGDAGQIGDAGQTTIAGLRALLDAENRRADEREHPSTLEGWIDSLFGRPSGRAADKARTAKPTKAGGKKPVVPYVRLLFGLDDPFAGRLDVTPKEVAAHGQVTPANVYQQLTKARETWQARPAVADLRRTVRAVVDAAGGAATVERAADELRAVMPHDRTADETLLRARAAALVRVVAEIEKEDPAGLRHVRLRDAVPWVFASATHAQAVERLGELADDIAGRQVLASPGEAARVLGEAAADTPLAALPPERLAALAAAAGRRAALSARLELYPRGLAPERALELCAAVLPSPATEDELRQRVRARYPAAAELPSRPALDELLRALPPRGFTWDQDGQTFGRPGDDAGTSLHTRVLSNERLPTALPHQPRLQTPQALAGRDFDERVRAVLERRSFCLLGVSANDRAPQAARVLAHRLGLRRVALDAALLAEVRELVKAHGLREEVVHEIDRLGPSGPEWKGLCNLMAEAARRLAALLFPAREPLLLVQPGLLERYRLLEFVEATLEAARREESAAILLLIPAHDTGGIPRINGRLVLPGVLPSQVQWVAREWLDNHDAAAA